MTEINAEDAKLIAAFNKKLSYKGDDLELFKNHRYKWQEELVKLTKTHNIVATIAGNRTGKTFSVMAMAAIHLLGDYPEDWTGRRFDKPVDLYFSAVDSNTNKVTGQKYLLGTSNRALEGDIGTGMIPRDRIIMESMLKERKGVIEGISIKHKSGGYSTITFKAYSQGEEAIQGFAADLVVIDEQPPVEFFSEIVKRTAVTKQGTPGLVLCSFTPLQGMNSMVEQFWSLPQTTNNQFDVRSGKLFTKKQRQNSNNDNRDSFGMIRVGWDAAPHIDENARKSILAAAPAYLRDAISKGIPVAGHGRVYPVGEEIEYNDVSHKLIDRNWKQLIGLDIGFGTKDPMAGVICSYDYKNDIIYVMEEFKKNVETEDEAARAIWALHPKVDVVWPRDGNKKQFKGQGTASNFLLEAGVQMLARPFENPIGSDGKRNIHKQPGFVEINTRFKANKLKINKNCYKLIKEISEYTYDQSGGTEKNEDHLLDALRYCVMSIKDGHGCIPGKNPFGFKTNNNVTEDKDFWKHYGNN